MSESPRRVNATTTLTTTTLARGQVMAEIHRSESAQERDAFGHWLSGFVDGEGSFIIAHKLTREQRYPAPYFEFAALKAQIRETRRYETGGTLLAAKAQVPPARPAEPTLFDHL